MGSFCEKVFTFAQVYLFPYIFLHCRCQKFPNLPNYCVLVQDPNDQCCGVPYCGNPKNPTPLASIPPQYQTMPPTTPMYVNPNQPSPISGSNTPAPVNGQYSILESLVYMDVLCTSQSCILQGFVYFQSCIIQCR